MLSFSSNKNEIFNEKSDEMNNWDDQNQGTFPKNQSSFFPLLLLITRL